MPRRKWYYTHFEADPLDEIHYLQDEMKCEFILDTEIFKDLIAFYMSENNYLCFALLKGFVFDIQNKELFKPRYISQFSGSQPTVQMDNVFYYGKSFMEIFKLLPQKPTLTPIVRRLCIGNSTSGHNDEYPCVVVEIEEYLKCDPICKEQHSGECHTHSMYPLCDCSTHIHNCFTEWERRVDAPKTRVMVPLMENFVSLGRCYEGLDCEKVKCDFKTLVHFYESHRFPKLHFATEVRLNLK